MAPIVLPKCLVVGGGLMGQAHVLTCRDILNANSVLCYAPSDKNRTAIESLGVKFETGPLEKVVDSFKPTHAIIASPVETLTAVTDSLIKQNVKNILIEKPAFLSLNDGMRLKGLQKELGLNVFVAYNRRFYSSVQKALSLIKENSETIENLFFEFTEWSHQIEKLDYIKPEVKEHWLLANSLHVIDLAFMPTGRPNPSKSMFVRSGSCSWHKAAANMNGTGYTSKNIPFAFMSNWKSPGRWSVEWVTNKRRYIFKPLEALKVQNIGSVAIEDVAIDDNIDKKYKAGVFEQNKNFLTNTNHPLLVNLDSALELVELGNAIAGYH